MFKNTKLTQQELKQAYQIVSQDLVHNLAKIKDGEGIRLTNLGTFIKSRQKPTNINNNQNQPTNNLAQGKPNKMTTGQKIPHMTGTIAEIQQGIVQIQMAQTQIIQSNQQLEQRLIALETNASSQFTNLVQQVQSIKSEIQEFKAAQQIAQVRIIALILETKASKAKIGSIDTAQLEYTFTTSLTYGTIMFAIVLATGKIAMFTIGLMVGIFLYKAGIIQKLTDYLPDFKGALTGFYEENIKPSLETKANYYENLLHENIAFSQRTQKIGIALGIGIFLLLAIAYF
ncbi:1492_t:CDS:2 [Funneliformis geosporum]|uniref:1492_t:CDS:1 n=1 Tax=Funneliformis geosporum TaxID=1117311 RepID=A0A9W4SGS4_9GLOM|nr:1492_t:CDS:2 [Funneliformis geosporum]